MPRKYTPEEAAAAFWTRVDKSAGPDACWPWMGQTGTGGYGQYKSRGVGGNRRAHRLAYEFSVGPIPAGLFICHRCDNPPCVNPAHLWAGSNGDNVRDAIAKGRWVNPALTRPDAFPKGSARAFAKVTEADVVEIRRRIDAGERQRAVAESFGINQTTAGQIWRREKWRHVP